MNEVEREIKAIDEATEIAKKSKAEELPLLDHPFSPCNCEDQRHCTTIVETPIRFPGPHNCGQPESAHRKAR